MGILRTWAISATVGFLISPVGHAQDWPTREWRAVTPASVGLDAGPLTELDRDIATGDKYPLVDSLLVMRCGRLAFKRNYPHDYQKIFWKEAHTSGPLNAYLSGRFNYFDASSFPFHQGTDVHSMQSVSKTVTSAIIGVAIARGDFKAPLDTPVLKYFDETKVKYVDERKRRMTIRNLLTMSAGLDWTEDVRYDDPKNTEIRMENSDDWVRFVIDRPMATEPGRTFLYNSGATELLAYIFAKETGQDIERYAGQFLFSPLGIQNYFWKRTPAGIVDAVGGVFLRAEDLAKIGYLYLRGGTWDGRRLLDKEWIRSSITPRLDAYEGWKYGFQWWLRPYGSSQRLAWAARGWGGQRMVIYPDEDLILVVTGWSIPVTTSTIEADAMEHVLQSARPHNCAAPTQ